MHIQKQEMRQ